MTLSGWVQLNIRLTDVSRAGNVRFNAMYYVYVIESVNFGSLYKGMTENLEQRLKEHNAGSTKSNKAFAPFKLVYFEEFEDREHARIREVYFKTSAGRRYLQKKGIRHQTR